MLTVRKGLSSYPAQAGDDTQLIVRSARALLRGLTSVRRHGLTPQQLFGWRREARRQAGDGGVIFELVMVESGTPMEGSPSATGHPASETDVATPTKVLRAVKAAT